MSGVNPGVRMAERIYNFCKKYHPKTNVMVSGVRKPAGLHVMTHSCEYLQERKQDAMLVVHGNMDSGEMYQNHRLTNSEALGMKTVRLHMQGEYW